MTACILGPGRPKDTGYHRSTVNGVRDYAHRHAYRDHVGPIPPGFTIDHLCRNRACVNPEHLEAVARGENCRRGAGAKLTFEQAQEIRVSAELHRVLAERYGVSRPTITNVRAGRNWRAAA